MRPLNIALLLVGVALVLLALVDAFDTIVLPRTVSRKFRATTIFFLLNRWSYEKIGDLRPSGTRQRLLGAFAPFTLFSLIVFWGAMIVFGFSLISSSLGTSFKGQGPTDLGNRIYFSATTFLTFGFGDFVPVTTVGKWIAVAEAATGFMFLALVIGYVPVFYASFSSREQRILLLDSKAGSDPTACEILRRHAEAGCLEELVDLFKDWEQFSAQLLENFLSYPILAFYRSQHDDQSWLNSLTSVMDACAICMTLFPGEDPLAKKLRFQARATFVMSRHLVVDFAYVMKNDPLKDALRLSPAKLRALARVVAEGGLDLKMDADSEKKFWETVELYQPFVRGLSFHLKMELPEWIASQRLPDNWETTAWDGSHF